MEILKKTLEGIQPPYKEAVEKARERIDSLTKPLGSLGILEEIGIKMAGITGKVHNRIDKKNIIIMCADNGVYEEGVSTCPLAFNIIGASLEAVNKMGTFEEAGIIDDLMAEVYRVK